MGGGVDLSELHTQCIMTYHFVDDEEDEADMEQVTPATAVANGSNAVETRDGSSILSKVFTAALKNQDKSWCVYCGVVLCSVVHICLCVVL